MSASRSPFVLAQSNTQHFFQGLPLHIFNQVGTDGLTGIDYYFNHFHHWEGPVAEGAAGGWKLTDATGTSTIVYGDVREGTISLTTDNTNSASACLQLGDATTGMNFGYKVGKRLACFTRFKTDSVGTGVKMFFGLSTATTTPGATAPTNGIYFRNTTTVNKLDCAAKEGSNLAATTNALTVATATYYVIGFVVDVLGNLRFYGGTTLSESTLLATVAVGATGLTTLDDSTKTLQFITNYVTTSTGAVHYFTMDYLLLAQEL